MKGILAIVLAVALVGCQPKQARREYVFPDFTRVTVDHNDPVARAAQIFFDEHQGKVEQDARNSQQDFVPAYSKFAAKVRPYIQLPAGSRDFDRDAALIANATLDRYLTPKGWMFRIADTYATDAAGQPIVLRVLMIGQLHSVRHANVVDVHGKTVSYTESIVTEAKQTRAREKSFRFTAFTEDTSIYHFLDGLEWSARRAVEDCRDGKAEGAEFAQAEWAGEFQVSGATPQFEARVMSDLLHSASAHERQHVIDHEFGALRLVKDDTPVAKVKLIMEIRGLLAQIASGGAEIYGFGHAVEWSESNDMISRATGGATITAIGSLPQSGDLRGFLRAKAARELRVSDELVLAALRHKEDPDPVGRAKEEHDKNR